MDKIYLFLYKFVNFVVEKLPDNFSLKIIEFILFLFYKFKKKRTKIMNINLGICFPPLNDKQRDDLIRKTYKNFAFFAQEIIKNQNLNKEQILNKVTFVNEEFLQDALKQNRPIIMVTAHYGNWEIFSLAIAAKYGASSVIGRELDSPSVNKIIAKNRQKFDIELIPKHGGVRKILSALKNKRILGILVDQSADANDGVECEFFGKKIMHQTAASIFAKKTNALIIPGFTRRDEKDPKKTKLILSKPIDINELGQNAIVKATQLQADATEEMIKSKPDEYFWMHQKFKYFYPDLYK